MAELSNFPHRRLNQLTGEWVMVSPHRTKRPWQGKEENPVPDTRPSYDPSCYLCPGNSRAGGAVNPEYERTYSFVNDYASILPENPGAPYAEGLLRAEPEKGLCKVICFSPRHDLTIPRMPVADLKAVIALWKKEYLEIGGLDYINHVQIFENHGALMGCSNPHPHCQIWAEESLPEIPAMEEARQSEYYSAHGTPLLIDYLRQELAAQVRVVCANDDFAAFVPYWAVWPYETIVIPKRQIRSLAEFDDRLAGSLASLMKELGVRYDNLFQTDFPYSMGIHQSPTDGQENAHWTFHIHYYPPLLRSATVKKFMVGYELLAMPQRDITPEMSAEILRGLSTVHYLEGGKA